MGDRTLDVTAIFDEHRKLLLAVAYRILGEWSEAEDVVQDAYLRWRDVEHAEVENPRAFLVQVTTRLSIDRLRSARSRRETYVGEWLPEPVLTGPAGADGVMELDVADRVAQNDAVSLAMLVVLEALSPLERAVFVLREAFDFSYAEIASMLERTEPAVRQLAKRARDHVERRRTRFETDRKVQREVTEKFMTAAANGRVDELLQLLAPDVELRGDGGGVMRAPRRPIVGADKVARFLRGGLTKEPYASMLQASQLYLAEINGVFGVVAVYHDAPVAAFACEIVDGRIVRIDAVVNPAKLNAVRSVAEVGIPLSPRE